MAPGPAAFASHLHQRSQSSLSFTILCKELARTTAHRPAYKVNRATHKRRKPSLATLGARLLSPGAAARTSPHRPKGNNKPTKSIKAIHSATPACASESMQSQRRQKLRDRAIIIYSQKRTHFQKANIKAVTGSNWKHSSYCEASSAIHCLGRLPCARHEHEGSRNQASTMSAPISQQCQPMPAPMNNCFGHRGPSRYNLA
jgi:hypothetical protein